MTYKKGMSKTTKRRGRNETAEIVTSIVPSARALTLEWYSKGPEWMATIMRGRELVGIGFGPTHMEAFAAASVRAAEIGIVA